MPVFRSTEKKESDALTVMRCLVTTTIGGVMQKSTLYVVGR